MKKKYIIVGDNNFWYHTVYEITEKELDDVITEIKRQIDEGYYTEAVDLKTPSELYAYEIKSTKEFKI